MAKVKTILVGARRNVAHPLSVNYKGCEHTKGKDCSAFGYAQLHSEVQLQVELGAKDKLETVLEEYQAKAVELVEANLGTQWKKEAGMTE